MRTSLPLLAVLGLVTSAPAAALDPDPSAPSLNGEVTLQSGFPGDPRVISVRAGGINRARMLGSDCTGYVANQPDYRITYQPRTGTLPLIFSVQSESDTMLAVRAPNGRWYCDDDSGGGSTPALRFNNPLPGRYAIFVGTYSSGANAAARLRISELTSSVASSANFDLGGRGTATASDSASRVRIDPAGESFNGSAALATGFGLRRVNVRAGGDANALTISAQCTGFVGTRPDYKVEYRAQSGGGKVGSARPLMFSVRSSADTMLVINGPDGRWYCDDDGGEGNNPLVRFDPPTSGRYDVFVGTYRAGDTVESELRISELDGDQ